MLRPRPRHSARFLAADGYHHHLGTNTWAGEGALPPEDGVARLEEWTIELPDATSVAGVGHSLAEGGYKGYYSFEWEKLWHPEIAEPEVALAHYPTAMKTHFRTI